ncbi:NADPH:quinone oxidoreductase family protein [Myxococcota bacterium]|nr:NADPH:quinone oxidoreductase family protein [Myxococcota bacterium]
MSVPTTMRAVHVASLTGPDAVSIVERPVPEPGPGEVLVKVGAGGLNYADLMQTMGLYVGGPKAPYWAGFEIAGEVVAAGEGASWPVGARVMGFGQESFAEYSIAHSAALFPTPEGWSDGQAVSFPVQWLTAHGCLRTVGRLKAGETVLIHAVAGGVGLAALRLAKRFGAITIGTASSPEKLAMAAERGLDHGIDYTKVSLVDEVKRITGGKGVDLVLEMVGGETLHQSWDVTRRYGRIVVYGAASGEAAKIDNVRLIFNPVEFIGYHITQLIAGRPDLFAEEMAEVTELLKAGVMTPESPTSWPVDLIQDALRALGERKTTGKQVVVF